MWSSQEKGPLDQGRQFLVKNLSNFLAKMEKVFILYLRSQESPPLRGVSHSAQQSLLQNQEFREAISNLISELLKRKAYGVYHSEG